MQILGEPHGPTSFLIVNNGGGGDDGDGDGACFLFFISTQGTGFVYFPFFFSLSHLLGGHSPPLLPPQERTTTATTNLEDLHRTPRLVPNGWASRHVAYVWGWGSSSHGFIGRALLLLVLPNRKGVALDEFMRRHKLVVE